jgi:putative Ig domain-containing protein
MGKGSAFILDILMLINERTATFVCAVVLCAISVLALTGCGGDSGPSPGGLAITTSALPAGPVNQPYSASLTGSGGTPPYTWSVAPALPNGLTLNAATGAVTGTPTTEGTTTHTFSLRDNSVPAQTVQQTLTVTVTPPPAAVTITTTSLPDGTVGQLYSRPVQATGGTGALTWTISAGSLPPNLNLDPATGIVSGTPTRTGTSSFTVRVQDAAGQSDTQPLSITINTTPPPPTPPEITITTLPPGTVGVAYNQPVQATGGTGALTWSIIAGSLPANVGLNATNGVISGTPTVEGTSSFTVRVQDAAGLSDVQDLSIRIDPPAPPDILTTTLPAGTLGQSYSQTLQAIGGTGARNWSIITGNLPPGLNLDANTGVISGTPTVPGTFSFTVQVQDAVGGTDQQALSIVINLSNPPDITTTTLSGGTVGQPYSQTLTASGGVGTLTWTVTGGSPPAGLSLSPNGIISGTPTAPGTANFTVSVTDSLGQSDTQSLSIVVSEALAITTNSLPAAQVGQPYNVTLQRSGGIAPFTWSVSPALPGGLSLDSATGQITGSPAAGTQGNYPLTFTLQDSSTPTPQTVSSPLQLTVNP